MPYKIDCVKAPDGTPCVLIQSAPEPMAALDLLRMLKRAFPEQWKEVNYDFSVNGRRHDLILPGGTNGRREVSDNGRAGDDAEPRGDTAAGGADGAGDVPGEVQS